MSLVFCVSIHHSCFAPSDAFSMSMHSFLFASSVSVLRCPVLEFALPNEGGVGV